MTVNNVAVSMSQSLVVVSKEEHQLDDLMENISQKGSHTSLITAMVEAKSWQRLEPQKTATFFAVTCTRTKEPKKEEWALSFLGDLQFQHQITRKELSQRISLALTSLSLDRQQVIEKCSREALGFLFSHSCAMGLYPVWIGPLTKSPRWKEISIEHQAKALYYTFQNYKQYSKYLLQKINIGRLCGFLCSPHLSTREKKSWTLDLIDGIFAHCTTKQKGAFEMEMLTQMHPKKQFVKLEGDLSLKDRLELVKTTYVGYNWKQRNSSMRASREKIV